MARTTYTKVVSLDAGAAKLRVRLAALMKAVPTALGGALYREGQRIMAVSQEEVPVHFGTLRRSGHVADPVVTATRATVKLGYGGPSAPYALAVHERTELHHKPPTKAKYLEDPVRAAVPGMTERLAADVAADLR